MPKLTAALLLLCLLSSLAVGCAPALPTFSPFDTEAQTEPSEESEAETDPDPIPLLTLDGRRFSFSGDPDAIDADHDRLTIRRGGVYRLSGTLTEGALAVDVGHGETVRLILGGASLTSSHSPCLSVISAAAVILESEGDSVNLFSARADSVIHADADLVLCGEGTLSLSGAENAIISTGTVSIEGGRLTATASEHGILAAYRIRLVDGAVTLSAAKVGMRCDEGFLGKGGIFLLGGSCTVLATETALRANTRMELSGGVASFRAPLLYLCEQKTGSASIQGTILHTGGDFPTPPS